MHVVVSGLPAAGKSTLGRALAGELAAAYIDKDDHLEELFESADSNPRERRPELSRRADDLFMADAQASDPSILVSFWRRDELSSTAGTPVGWLHGLPAVVEVFCRCDPAIAAQRFVERRRHPGHGDDRATFEEVYERFATLAEFGPLGVGALIEVDTGSAVDLASLAAEVRTLWNRR